MKPDPNAAPSTRMIRNGNTNTKKAPVLSRVSRRTLTRAIATAFREVHRATIRDARAQAIAPVTTAIETTPTIGPMMSAVVPP